MSSHQIQQAQATANPGIDGFWEIIARAPSVALLLDYDGTLAPFHVDRLQAVPVTGAVDAIQDMRSKTDTIVALVSGRPVQEILQLVSDPGVTIIGTHGFEVRSPDGKISTAAISNRQSEMLDRAYQDAARFIGDGRTERKVATVAAHFRGLDRLDARQHQQDILTRWLEYADRSVVEVRQFNGGIEMRALGRHKGTAVAEFLDTYPDNTLAVYIGDDDTDEDAFRTVKARNGYAIRVGGITGNTEATGSLNTCEDVVSFLKAWTGARQTS